MFYCIFTNYFERQSLNYDPDMFYSLNTVLPPSSFVLTSSQHLAVRKLNDGAPSGEFVN